MESQRAGHDWVTNTYNTHCLPWVGEWKSLSRVQLFQPHGLYPWNSLGQNTGVGSLPLLQGIFPTQGSDPGLPYCRWFLDHLNHQGSQTWPTGHISSGPWHFSSFVSYHASSHSSIQHCLCFSSSHMMFCFPFQGLSYVLISLAIWSLFSYFLIH